MADAEFPTSPAGYDDAVRWARSFGSVAIAGVEGTSSYGAGLTRWAMVGWHAAPGTPRLAQRGK